MALLALVAASSLVWSTWSAETLDQARRRDRAVFLVVSGRARPAILEDDAVAQALTSFVAVCVDRDERPDLDDVTRLALSAVSEADPRGPAAPLWVVLTPSLHPLAGGDLGTPDAGGLAQKLLSLAAEYREERGDVELRGGVAAARLAAAQTPVPPRGALDRVAVDRAVAAAREDAEPTPGRLRLLLAVSAPSPPAALRLPLGPLLASLAQAPSGAGLADDALRLRALADAFSLTGDAAQREAASALAVRLVQGPRLGEGLFLAAPGDDRAFAFENGLVISALVASSSALGRADERAAASRAAAAAAGGLGPWPALARWVGPEGRGGPGFLEDYAFLAEAFLDLHDATGETRWRDEAQRAVDAAIARFLDSAAGGFFTTDAAHAPLPVRLKSGYDGARPSANGVMASVLARLGRATGERRYADLARGVLDAFRGDLQAAPRGMETMAAAAIPFVATPDTTRGAARPARETRGPVAVEAAVRPAGTALEAAVMLTMTPPWTVNGRRPAGRGLVPLTVSVPDERFSVTGVDYPECENCAGSARVVVRLRPGAAAGRADALRLTTRFQACRGGACEAPESVVLDAPLAPGVPAR